MVIHYHLDLEMKDWSVICIPFKPVATGMVALAFQSTLIGEPAVARCQDGFSTPPGYNYCVPSSSTDRKTWNACADESRRLGLPEIKQFGEKRRVEIVDKFIDYCRRAKLPHLY
jgi:hypothetical protein